MTRKTKVIVWAGVILGTFSIAALAIVIAIALHTGNAAAERQRQQQQAATQLKEGLAQDLKTLSQTQVKPMTGDDIRKWVSGANSPTPTPGK
jgi:hypothetical protein